MLRATEKRKAGMEQGDKNSPAWDKLGARIEEVREETEPRKTSEAVEYQRGSNMAWTILIELCAALGIGLFIGYALDKWLGTSPLFILVCAFLGIGGGFLNAYRAATGKPNTVGFKKEEE